VGNLLWPVSKYETGTLGRLGRALHWLGFGAALAMVLILLWAVTAGKVSNYFNDITWVLMWALGLGIAGRLARYVLANE